MGITSQVIQVVLFFEALQLVVGFVQLDTTATPLEKLSKGYLKNISLAHLTSNDLKFVSPDVTFLKISNSEIGEVQKNAFDHLTHLNLLEISDAEIRQEIDPQTFSRLPGLEILVLKHVGLRRVNLNLTNVQELILSQNEIETFDGRAVEGRNLNFLDLSSNKLKVLEGTFANVSKLSMIDISKNKISAVPPVFQENVKLLRILASANKIKSTNGLRLPWLKTLDLFANEIEVLDSESLSGMSALEELVLAFNRIESVEDAFEDLLELKDLNLAWNKIEKLDAGLFRNNVYLTKLSLQGNKIGSLVRFQNVHPHLTHLDLSHNQLLRIDGDFFGSTPALQVLDLSFNRLKAVADVFSPLAELKILNLAYNHIVMTGNELHANHQLSRVNLSTNGLRGGLSHFRNNNLLTELDLSDNEISDFCDGDVALKSLLKVNLRGNQIKSLNCLNGFKALCEVDLRNNPLTCGEELDSLILRLAKKRGSPFKLSTEYTDVLSNQCENLSWNRSFSLWNTVKREVCPQGGDVVPKMEAEAEEWGSAEGNAKEPAAERFEMRQKPIERQEGKPTRKEFINVPLLWIKNDEMEKPNPMENPQSGRVSWGSIDENSELLNGFEDEELEKKPRFSWYTIALILIGLSLTLTCFNLFVFLYIRLRVWKRADVVSSQKYTALHNEVYKNTTEPSRVCPGGEEWVVENETRNKIFTYGKINEILLNFGLNKKDKDSESVKNILIHSSNGSQTF